jgi:hypothetical protein
MQGLGALYALLPVLRRAPDPAAALRRHAGYFNINVWMAPVVLGGMARLEGEGRAVEAAHLRDWLAAPLSGAADVFVWSALRPACLGLALVLVLAGLPAGGLALGLVAYDSPLLWLYAHGFERGAAAGAEMGRALRALQPPAAVVRVLRHAVALLAGGLAAWNLLEALDAAPGRAFGVGAALVLGYYAARRDVSPGITLLILVVLSSLARQVAPSQPAWVP